MLTLSDIKVGQEVIIKDIQDPDVFTQALRMGISPGETIQCVARVPAGPVVIQRGGMELAIGKGLCSKIEVAYP
jgi:Fe2+ transport system protein FeoA